MNISFEDIRFLDGNGSALCYVFSKNILRCVPLQGLLTGGSVSSPYPLPNRMVFPWHDLMGDKIPLPEIEMNVLENALVSMYDVESSMFLTSCLDASDQPFSTHDLIKIKEVNEWGKFLPLTHDMFVGLLALTSPDMVRIVTDEGINEPRLGFLGFEKKSPFLAAIKEKTFYLYDNLEALLHVARLRSGETKKITIKGNIEEREYLFYVTKL